MFLDAAPCSYVAFFATSHQGFSKSSKCFTSHSYISCLTQIATGFGAQRGCSSLAPGHCQSRLEGFEGTGLDYAGVKLVPGDYGSWEKRLNVCTVRCYSLEFQGSSHGFGTGCGLDFGRCSLGGLEHG